MTAMYLAVTLSSVKRRPLIATVLRPMPSILDWGVEAKNAPQTPLLPSSPPPSPPLKKIDKHHLFQGGFS